MKTKVLVGILLFLIVLNLSTIGVFVYHLLRQEPGESGLPPFDENRPPGAMGSQMPMMNIRPEVRERMHALMMRFRADVNNLQEKMFQLEDTTVALLRNDPPPMARVDENLEKVSDLRLLINQKAVRSLLSAKSFLTREEQEMFFRAIMQAHPQGGRMGGGMGRGSMSGRQMGQGRGRFDSTRSH